MEDYQQNCCKRQKRRSYINQGVYQPGKLRKKITQGNHGKLIENDEDLGKIMSIPALS